MELLLILVTATAISLAVIPVMVRLAPHLGMLDHPASRKVHVHPIPRVGGWGIVLGAVIALGIWLPLDEMVLTYAFGAVVLFGFGAVDDYREQSPAVKFLGQALAVIPVVTLGGLRVDFLPYGIGAIPEYVAIPFTIFALLGMINAVNHSDGLDGLAGGESLLSLGALCLLLYLGGGEAGLALAIACVGGVFGFLRYNTHPARLFMGDGGSQFLGFTLGFLAVLLTQRIDATLSPAVVLLILGLPIADILVVFAKRVRGGMSWFHATRNHIHHRLLEMGFHHQDAVLIIYSVQALMVTSGLFLRYAPDWLITAVYLLIAGCLFQAMSHAERIGWRAYVGGGMSRLWRGVGAVRSSQALVVVPRRFLEVAVPVALLAGSAGAAEVSRDFGIAALAAGVALLMEPFLRAGPNSMVRRGLIYTVVTFVVYLHTMVPGSAWEGGLAEWMFLGLIAISVMIAVRFSPGRRRLEFRATAMDYLLVVLVALALVLSRLFGDAAISDRFIIGLAVLFYASELLIVEHRTRWDGLGVASVGAAMILAARGLL